MERKLQLLDSFDALGDDGVTYRVLGYEHLVRDESWRIDGLERWQSTGQAEYRLADGRRVDMGRDEVMHIAGTGVALRATHERPAAARASRGTGRPAQIDTGRNTAAQ